MTIQSEGDLIGLRTVGRVAATALEAMRREVRPGISTRDLDEVASEVFRRNGARSAPQLVYNFPGATCISVNDEVVHGIPGDRVLAPGDVVKLDVTAELGGYMADTACTVVVAGSGGLGARLASCARSAFRQALAVAKAGALVSRVGSRVEAAVSGEGFRVIKSLCGHGIGRSIHEPPEVPNAYDPRMRDRFEDGMVVTIEPIIAAGNGRSFMDKDGWTVRTSDGSLAAHYEHTLVVTRGRPEILTALDPAA